MFGDDWEATPATMGFGESPAGLLDPEPSPPRVAPVVEIESSPTSSGDRRALYLRWRPRRFEDVVGQQHVTRTLRNAVQHGRLAHAYLLTGPRGTGKTSIARILYRAANCLNTVDGDPCNACPLCRAALDGRALDLVEIDAASNRGIDDIRDLRDKIGYRPGDGRYRLYIVDEAHELTNIAWDAFLKTIEEPPEHVIFVLATTEAHKVPATIISRCQRFDLRRIPFDDTREQLRHVADAEGLEVEPEVLDRLARAARGGLRDALSLLDQLSSFGGGRVDMAVARAVLGLPPVETVQHLVEALGRRDGAVALGTLLDVAEGGADLRQLVEELAARLRALLLMRSGAEQSLGSEYSREELAWLRERSDQWTLGALMALVQELTTALARTRDAQQFQVQVELSLLSHCGDGGPRIVLPRPPAATGEPRPTPAATLGPALLPGSVARQRDGGAAAPPGNWAEVPSSPARAPRTEGEAEAASPAFPPVPEPPVAAADRRVAAVPTSALSASTETTDSDAVLTRVRACWPDIVERAHARNPLVGAPLSTARPLRMEDDVMVIAFERLQKQFERPTFKRAVEGAVQHALGRPCRIRLVALDDGADGGPNLYDDPVISHAVRMFGGHPRRLEPAEPGAAPAPGAESGEIAREDDEPPF